MVSPPTVNILLATRECNGPNHGQPAAGWHRQAYRQRFRTRTIDVRARFGRVVPIRVIDHKEGQHFPWKGVSSRCSWIDFHPALPVKNCAVCCSDRRGMHHLLPEWVLGSLLLIDLDPEARTFGFQPITIASLERVPHHFPSPRHVS